MLLDHFTSGDEYFKADNHLWLNVLTPIYTDELCKYV